VIFSPRYQDLSAIAKNSDGGKGSAATKPFHKEVVEVSWYGLGFQGQSDQPRKWQKGLSQDQ